MAWSFSKLAFRDKALFQQIAEIACQKLRDFAAQGVAKTAWSFAKQEIMHEPLMQGLAAAAVRVVHDFPAQFLSNTVWAYAKLSYKDRALQRAVLSVALPQLTWKAQEVDNTVWAFAVLRWADEKALVAMADIAKPLLGQMDSQDVSLIAWSFASLEYGDVPLFQEIVPHALRVMPDFSEQGISNLAWAYATVGYKDQTLVDALVTATTMRSPVLHLQSLANLAWAFSCLAVDDDPVFDAIAARSVALLEAHAQADTGEGPGQKPRALGLLGAMASAGFGRKAQKRLDLVLDAAMLEVQARAATWDAQAKPLPPGRVPQDPQGDPDAVPRVLEEKQDAFVLWKPAGWTVSTGTFGDESSEEDGPRDGFLGASKPLQEWLRMNLGSRFPISGDASVQYGIAHRLDRNTSGPLLCAKTYKGFLRLLFLFAASRTQKQYLALCEGWLDPTPRQLTKPLKVGAGSGSLSRTYIAEVGQRACTEILQVFHLRSADGEQFSLVQIQLRTGRMHQIRVHLSAEGHPLVGDPLYGRGPRSFCPRIFLHSLSLAVEMEDGRLAAQCPLPKDLRRPLASLEEVGPRAQLPQQWWYRG